MKAYKFHGETKDIDSVARNAALGQFVLLTDGFTHYELDGAENQRVTVLVPGFSVPMFIWDPTFEGLVSSGLHVLRYDLFGRGYSDRPDIIYNQACYDRQLYDLLHTLNINSPINLVGLSMGGAVAVGFTASHPELVRKLVLIDPAGMPMEKSPLMNLIRIRGFGEWLFDTFAEKLIVANLAKDFYTRHLVAELQAKYRTQMQYRGFKRALLSTLRHGPLQTMAEAYTRVGHLSKPVLLIWGREDRTVPFALSHKVRSALPHAEFHAIQSAGHIPHYEQPDMVNQLMVDFLQAE
jgi:pimeloyl-ACP methyl ester carboxylesterase